jgi:hypothetical protein
VTLKGSVDNADTKSRAEQVAKKVEGVKSVKNELRVKGSVARAKPRCRVAVLEPGGAVQATRDYRSDDPGYVETP